MIDPYGKPDRTDIKRQRDIQPTNKQPDDWLPSLDDRDTGDSVKGVMENTGRKGGAELHPEDAK